MPPITESVLAAREAEASRSWTEYRRLADLYFRAALALTLCLTTAWVVLILLGRDGGPAVKAYRIGLDGIARVAAGFTVMTLLWGWLWYGVKRLILRKVVGLSGEQLRSAFSSRMTDPFDLRALVDARNERRVRVADMIGRRGRFFMIGLAGFIYLYTRVTREPTQDFLYMGLQENLFDAIAFNWLMLGFYYSNGWLGRVSYGAQTRIMDGTLGRANCLVITMLWSVFKFIMVPIGVQLAAHFPPHTYATVFAFVWLSYLVGDGLSEIVGQSFGSQRLRVWGIGEVNRKSVAGTWACFLGSLAVCLSLVAANGLGPAWVGLALAVSVSNTVFELFSPRGTDDFTMATANALLCWGFGAVVL